MTNQPKLWRDMTREEKGALLLEEHEGKVIDVWQGPFGWQKAVGVPLWQDDEAYRSRPEPKRETKVFDYCTSKSTYRYTFVTVDGEPDCASIRMEKL